MALARRQLHEGQEVLDLDLGGAEDGGVPAQAILDALGISPQ